LLQKRCHSKIFSDVDCDVLVGLPEQTGDFSHRDTLEGDVYGSYHLSDEEVECGEEFIRADDDYQVRVSDVVMTGVAKEEME